MINTMTIWYEDTDRKSNVLSSTGKICGGRMQYCMRNLFVMILSPFFMKYTLFLDNGKALEYLDAHFQLHFVLSI